jgi:hypothetical protein
MNAIARTGLVALMAIVAQGCASAPLTPMQKRQLTTRLVRSDFEPAYRATLSVLQDEGYSIRETDYEAGFISAHFTPRYESDHSLEMSAVVVQLSETQSEIRMTLIHAPSDDDGSWFANLFRGSHDPAVTDRDVFQRLFRQIETEIERRKAIG